MRVAQNPARPVIIPIYAEGEVSSYCIANITCCPQKNIKEYSSEPLITKIYQALYKPRRQNPAAKKRRESKRKEERVKEKKREEMEKVVPDSVMEAVKRTSNNIEEFKAHFPDFLTHCTPESLEELEPLERAQSLLLLAKATTTLFTLRLRCSGVHPDDHPVKSELERLSLYQEKLERFIDLSKAPLRPSTTINPQAATRFIEHSLPDLTPEQKQSMREISSRGEGVKYKYLERNVHKKRKCESAQKQSVQSAAQEFLEKAARELLGDNKGGLKGPLQPQDSDEEE